MAVDWKTWAPVLVGAGATGYSAWQSQRNRNQDREDAADAREEDRADRRETNILDLASRESLADPFRHQNNQAASLAMLDRIANARRGQTQINVPPEMARFMPTRTGGYSYEASPDLRTAAQLLQRSVASGETAPTMTNPANYGLTGARNLNDPSSIGMGARPNAPAPTAPGAGGAVPRTGSPSTAPGTMSSSFFSGGPDFSGGADAGSDSYSLDERDVTMNAAAANPYYTNYRRRKEGAGGALSGGATWAGRGATVGSVIPGVGTAAGAVIGGIGGLIGGAFSKNAKTAMSDFYVDDAREILRDWSRDNLGREVSEEEIQEALEGQGLKPGHRWVGQQGLDYILQQWAARIPRDAAEEDEQLAPSYAGLFA